MHVNRWFSLSLRASYELSSGYKPAPMDLSHIKLASTQEAMVDKLAENAHNVWARDRIRQGWTYGIQQVCVCDVCVCVVRGRSMCVHVCMPYAVFIPVINKK